MKKKTTRKMTRKMAASKSTTPTLPPPRSPAEARARKPIGRPRKHTPAEAAEIDKKRKTRQSRERRGKLKALAEEVAGNEPKRVAISRELKRKRGVTGKPPFEPTLEQRKNVETMAGLGLRQEEMCLLVINPRTERPIRLETLIRYFSDELARGAPLLHLSIAQSLVKKALGDGPQAVTAGIWVSKCRMGWKERLAVEVEVKSGVVVAPAAMTPNEWIAQAAARTENKPEPGTED